MHNYSDTSLHADQHRRPRQRIRAHSGHDCSPTPAQMAQPSCPAIDAAHLSTTPCGLPSVLQLHSAEWLERHITLTEGLGVTINKLVMAPLFPGDECVFTTDATASAAAAMHRARADDLLILQNETSKDPRGAAAPQQPHGDNDRGKRRLGGNRSPRQ